MGTYSTIQTRVQRRLIDLPAAVLAEVPQLVNEAVKTLQTRHNFKVMEVEGGPYVTNHLASDGGRMLTVIPTTFKEYRFEPYYLVNPIVTPFGFTAAGARLMPMTIAPDRKALFTSIGESDYSAPMVLLEVPTDQAGGKAWNVYPLPDGASDWPDTEYRVYVPMYSYLPDLVNAGDTNWFTTQAEEYIVLKATAEGFAIDWDNEHYSVWLAKSELEYKKIVLRDKTSRLSSVNELVPHWRGAREPRLRW